MSEEYPILEGEAAEDAKRRIISKMYSHLSKNDVLDTNKDMRQITKILIEAAIAGREEEHNIEKEENKKLTPPAKSIIFCPDQPAALASAIACTITGGDIDDWNFSSAAGFLIQAFSAATILTEMVNHIDDIFSDEPPGWYCLRQSLTALDHFDPKGD